MSSVATVARSVEVDLDPTTAFEVFTEEIDAWYVRGPYSWNDPGRAVGMRFEPGVGGRWLELWDEVTGEGYEIGRVLVWEPGERLVVSYRSVHLPPEPQTEIEVRFEPSESGTKVTLEHRGLERLPPHVVEAFATRAWVSFMRAFREYVMKTRGER
jgi:hypothetical protein